MHDDQVNVANSTESVDLAFGEYAIPPTTISWLSGRTAAKHNDRAVGMLLMIFQESVAELYMQIAVLELAVSGVRCTPPTTRSLS